MPQRCVNGCVERRQSTAAPWLGFRARGEIEGERRHGGEGKPWAKEEEVAVVLSSRGRARGSTRAGGNDRAQQWRRSEEQGEDDRVGFPDNPLYFLSFFPLGPFLFYFSVFYLKHAVNHLIGDPKHFQTL